MVLFFTLLRILQVLIHEILLVRISSQDGLLLLFLFNCICPNLAVNVYLVFVRLSQRQLDSLLAFGGRRSNGFQGEFLSQIVLAALLAVVVDQQDCQARKNQEAANENDVEVDPPLERLGEFGLTCFGKLVCRFFPLRTLFLALDCHLRDLG